ncbi:hypothetical protein AB6A40_000658 [Gnathostoma spinigerum]|uniref:Innexin n=1 Tax=Gnathostoma spinigerum TaxID=75299 RepID=A0ABD6E2I2_9BILA
MLGIPLIGDYIHKVVKPQSVSDSVDYLNYYCTSLLLALAALAISAKQYFGSPIQCWVPMEFRGGWEKYTEDYCFIQNSYYVPFDEQIPDELSERRDQLSYYRWVPIVLALQALCFFAPNYFWEMLYKQTAIRPRAIVNDAEKCMNLQGDRRDSEVRSLAEYIADTVAIFSPQHKRHKKDIHGSGKSATLLYLCTKALYVANIIIQLWMMNHFLGGHYLYWGYETMMDVASGKVWQESPIFPRVIMCDFEVRRLGNIQRHTVQCVIMMNMINEKLYLFLWFWLLFVLICTVLNFVYTSFVLLTPCARTRLVLWNISKQEMKRHGLSSNDCEKFVHYFLHTDGVLLLKFIREHVGDRISRDIVIRLLGIYNKQNLSNDSDERSPSFCSDEKQPLNREKPMIDYLRNFPLHKSGIYPPRMYPTPAQMPAIQKPYESSAPPLEDYLDGTTSTLPISAMARVRAAQIESPAENPYGAHSSRHSSPTEV